MLVGLKLWSAFNNPPSSHPLFQYVLTHSRKFTPHPTYMFFMWMMMLSGFGFCWSAIFDWIPRVIIIFLLLLNTAYSVIWAMNISGEIVAEKDRGRYDLLAALPIGTFGTSWAMCTGYLHRRVSFVWIPFLIRMATIIAIITLIGTLGITLFVISNDSLTSAMYIANFNIIPILIAAFAFIIMFYIDHLYSAVASLLIAMQMPVDLNNSNEARIRTFGLFVLMQMLTYVVVAGLAIVVFPQIFRFMGWVDLSALIVQALLSVLIFWLIRELTVRQLWRCLKIKLNAEAFEEYDLLQSSS